MLSRSCLSIALALTCPVASGADEPPATQPSKVTRNVAIVVHEGVELLDFAGPGEVFETASWRGAEMGRPWFNMYTVAPTTGSVLAQLFVTIEPEYTIDNCPPPDILIIPGGATAVLLRDEHFVDWVRQVAPKMVSTLVVKTVIFSSESSSLKSTSVPVERPIQCFCMVRTRSGQPSSSSAW